MRTLDFNKILLIDENKIICNVIKEFFLNHNCTNLEIIESAEEIKCSKEYYDLIILNITYKNCIKDLISSVKFIRNNFYYRKLLILTNFCTRDKCLKYKFYE